MYTLFIVLVAGMPIFGVAFATSLLGLGVPRRNINAKIMPLAEAERYALGRTAGNARYRHKGGAQHSPKDRRISTLTASSWRQILGLPLNEHRRSKAHKAYRALARANHPDLSGSNEAMQRINDAWRQAKSELILK